MAQFYFDRLDALALPGEPIETGARVADADFYSRAPAIIFESNRTSNANSSFVVPVVAADVDVRARFRVLRNGAQAFTNTGPGIHLRYEGVGDCLYMSTRNPVDSASVWAGLYKMVGGTQTALTGNVNAVQPALFQAFNMRVRIQGNQFQQSAWLEGDAVPALSTAITVDVSGAPASGFVGVRGRQYPIIFEVDLLAIGTDGDTPPTESQRSVSGVVSGPDGNPAERIVRLHDRATGAMVGQTVSNGMTGVFVIKSDWPQEHQHIALAEQDSTPLYNDLIDRVFPG